MSEPYELKFIRDFAEGDLVETFAGVRSLRFGTTKRGDPFVDVEAFDRTGSIKVKIWECEDPAFAEGDLVYFAGEVKEWNGDLQLEVGLEDDWSREESDEHRPRVVRLPGRPIEELWSDLLAIVDAVEGFHVRTLLRAMLEKLQTQFKSFPAAAKNHHAYHGGLLDHVLSMAKLGAAVGAHYASEHPGKVDADIVIAGCIVHDIGKCFDFVPEGLGFKPTAAAQIIGHIANGDHFIFETSREMLTDGRWDFADLDVFAPVVLHLRHVVLSHHGRLEYGSPVRPKTIEAHLVHLVDMMDSRAAMAAEALEGLEGEFSERVWTLDRERLWNVHGN